MGAERFETAIDMLLSDRSPCRVAPELSDEQRRMLRMAQLLRGSRSEDVSADFIERLHARLYPPQIRLTRRAALFSTVGTMAASFLAGIGLERSTQHPATWSAPPLVVANGEWYRVASTSDLTDGAIRPFSAGAVHGFLLKQGDEIHALSRVCTHMGCMLEANVRERTLECPCHGAEFDLRGHLRYGPTKYGQPLPPLPPLRTRVRGEAVEVFSV